MKSSLVPVLLLLLPACATLQSDGEDEGLSIANASKVKMESVDAKSSSGVATYQDGSSAFKVEWISCRKPGVKRTMLVMHRSKKGFAFQSFCKTWIAQSFLAEDFDVLAVNRPGFGRSSGKSDFGGKRSVKAIKAAVDIARKTKKLPAPVGAWGYSSGAMAATMVAKELPSLKFLLLGGGIYDLEETYTATKDRHIKNKIAALKKAKGDTALEDRSIAYDFEGLPKRIALYHGKKDRAIPPSQATMFHESLVSSEYQASLQILKGVSHEIPLKTHRQILQVLARSLK